MELFGGNNAFSLDLVFKVSQVEIFKIEDFIFISLQSFTCCLTFLELVYIFYLNSINYHFSRL